jgi:Mu-like prophage I protein
MIAPAKRGKPAKGDATPPKPKRSPRYGGKGLRMKIGADGTVHVRHLADNGTGGQLALFRGLVELSDAANDTGPKWIQVAKVGSWAGHPAGQFQLTEKEFGEVVANFKATTNQRIPIDFEHASEADPNKGEIANKGAPAQGWILDLDNRAAAGLWALVDWLPLARGYIQGGQYKYCSPAIRFNSKDRVTGNPIGARMTSLGLTNTPFLDGMQSIAAKDFEDGASVALDGNGMAYSANECFPSLRYALGCDDLASPDEMLDRLERIEELCDQAGGDGSAVIEGVDLSRYICELRAVMRVPLDTTLADLFDRVETLISAAIPGGSDKADEAELSDKETPPMAEPQTTISLKDHEAAVETAKATITLQLKDASSKLLIAETENARLLKEIETRDAGVVTARVEEAFGTYSESRKLTDIDKKAMTIVLKSDPATFDALYPKVTGANKALLTTLSDKTGLTLAAGQLHAVPDIVVLTDKYVKEGMSLEDANARAYTEASSFG